MPAKRLTETDVIISVTPEPEDEGPYWSQYSVAKDHEDAQRYSDAVEDMCDKYPDWGWCVVKVAARLGALEAFSYLGNCSYKDIEDFKSGGY